MEVTILGKIIPNICLYESVRCIHPGPFRMPHCWVCSCRKHTRTGVIFADVVQTVATRICKETEMPIRTPRHELFIVFVIGKAKEVAAAVLLGGKRRMTASAFMPTHTEPNFKFKASKNALAEMLASHEFAQAPCLDVAVTPFVDNSGKPRFEAAVPVALGLSPPGCAFGSCVHKHVIQHNQSNMLKDYAQKR